jgi:serine/threonine protein kinase
MGNSPAIHDAGQEFHKYRLREPLSESFLGTRYRAVSNASGNARAASAAFGSDPTELRSSAFALRLLRAPSAGLIERVARAAKAVRFVEHPNLLVPIQLIRAQTRLGVITQDIEGVTLSEVLRQASSHGEALPQAMALRIVLDVLEGVLALHGSENDAKRYLYACGGLTPDSVHVGKDGRSRLIDPGVAGAAAMMPCWGHDPVALAYTAPEHSGAEPHFNPGSDAFAIGVMLWEMLAGRTLFGAPTAAETLEHLHKSIIPRVQRYQFVRGEPISAAVAQVVSHALQRDPKLRHPSCRELAAQLFDSAEVNTHDEVAEHCHRLAGSSAGVFDGQARPRTVISRGEFELPTGTLPRASSVPPAPRPPIRAPRELVPPDLFEPQTARMTGPLPPMHEHAPHAKQPDGPITAFPISDFVRTASAEVELPNLRRWYAPLAAAAVVVLGLSYLLFRSPGDRAQSPVRVTASQPDTAAAAPAAAHASVESPAPNLELGTTVAVEPMPAAFGGTPRAPIPAETANPATPSVTVVRETPVDESRPSHAQPSASATKRTESSRRRSAKPASATASKVAETAATTGSVPSGPFIPDDL